MDTTTDLRLDIRGQPLLTRVLARMATTGIYLVRGVPLELQRSARARAVREGTTLRRVLLGALRDYAAGTWTPCADDQPSAAGAREGGGRR